MVDKFATDDRVVVTGYDTNGSYGVDGREGAVIDPHADDDRPFTTESLVEVRLDENPDDMDLDTWLFRPDELVRA